MSLIQSLNKIFCAGLNWRLLLQKLLEKILIETDDCEFGVRVVVEDTSEPCVATPQTVEIDAKLSNADTIDAGKRSVWLLNSGNIVVSYSANGGSTVNLEPGQFTEFEVMYDACSNTYLTTPQVDYNATGGELWIKVIQ